MKSDIKLIAESFSKHKFESTFENMSEDIEWILIGGDDLKGKEEIIKTCQESTYYLSNIKVTFNQFKTLVGENFVVVESTAEYTDPENLKSVVASCDIYEFNEDQLIKITSYNIEVPHSH